MKCEIVIVGASLGGLSAACALRRKGFDVRVYERAHEGFETRGGGLGLDVELAAEVAGSASPPHLLLGRRRVWHHGAVWEERVRERVTAYGALWRWFAGHLPDGALQLGEPVVALEETSENLLVRLGSGRQERYDLAVVADGGQGASLGWFPRGAPRYAGYVLWRGLCPVGKLPDPEALEDTLAIARNGNRHFVAYHIPPYDGSPAPAHRMVNWGCYLLTEESEARDLLQVRGRSLMPHALETGAPEHWAEALARDAPGWPGWRQGLVEATARHGMIAPHPVFELEPRRLRGERVALVGDCAHLASPITGSGARMAFGDALALADSLTHADTLGGALANYEATRLPEVRAVVARGQQFGASLKAAD